jgi:disulfide bond formation protein DsbB
VTTATVSLFLALLAVVAEAATVVLLALAGGTRLSPRLAHARAALHATLAPQALLLALAVAAVATAGSLYFSEIAHFTPCRLCWAQRFCMYPLVPILGWCAWRRDVRLARWLGLPLAGVGGLIAAYHVVLERYPTLESGACDPDNPCTIIWVRRLGYLTIPAMALSGFIAIVAMLLVARDDGA